MPTRPKNATTKTRTESKQHSGEIQTPRGKLGIMIPGMGAVATTFVAGVEAVRKGIAKPIGSLTQMGTIRLGKRTDALSPKIKEFVPDIQKPIFYISGPEPMVESVGNSLKEFGIAADHLKQDWFPGYLTE